MIHNALRVIQQELNSHLGNIPNMRSEKNLVVLGNIAKIDDSSNATSMQDMVIVSLVNIEEEKILKNNPHYKNINGSLLRGNPTIFLNCYILFTANFGDVDAESLVNKHELSLQFLSEIVTFFQKKMVFDHQNTPQLDPKIEKLILDIHTLNFENLNHLWGILGGKYLPSVLYKVRLVPIESNANELASVITGVEIKDN